jgi:hypothetical protein
MQDANMPFLLHIGAGKISVDPRYRNNGLKSLDFLGGGENVRAREFRQMHAPSEIFLTRMVLDGAF